MTTLLAAELLVETLADAGVERIYGITGDTANYITDSISRSPIRFIHTRHEEVAAFAAGAEAKATGKLAVCMGSCGPGSLHLVNGLYESHRNGSPVLAIVTEIHQSQIGTQFIQEIDTRNVFSGCSHFCEYARRPADLPRLLGIAMQTAISKRGVSVIIITAEVLSAPMFHDTKVSYLPNYTKPIIRPCDDEISELAKLLNIPSNIAIYGGAGCIGASEEVFQLAKLLKSPIMWTYIGKEALDYNNPYPVGLHGLLGTSASNETMENCDTLLLLGCGFAFPALYPDNKKIIQVDIAGENLGRRHTISLGLVGDIKETLKVLLPLLVEKKDDSFALGCAKKYKTANSSLHKLCEQSTDSKKPIYPEHLMDLLNRKIDADAWVSADMGTPWAFAGRYIESKGGRKFYTSSLHGTMAGAMPSSIGLCLAAPSKQVIALCGDGGISMLLGDILTLKQEKLNPKLFIFNNSRLDFVSMEMKADGLLDSYTNLENPNFANVATTMGIKGIRVETAAQLEAAIDEALQSKEAVLVDVVVEPDALLVPPKITHEMVGKYSHYVAKMLLKGETEEVLHDALTNMRKV